MFKRGVWVFSMVLMLALGFVLATGTLQLGLARPAPALQSDTTALALNEQESQFSEIYRRVSPSVVAISVTARTSGSVSDAFPDNEGFSFGQGSGFVIDTAGHIVTNNHVVDGATRIEVNFFDGTIARGEVVGLDPDSDLAVVRVDVAPQHLVPVTFADSDSLTIGQYTLAIGSPFGQRWTLTTGIISALGRSIEGLSNYSIGSVIQTDAAINPGNSGGPLLDLQGRVIGVNSQIISENRSSAGIGFAVPSNLVQRVAADLIQTGDVDYSYLGIQGRDVDLSLVESLALPNGTRGAVVAGVEPSGPAAQGGVRNPANIAVIDGQEVPSEADIIVAIDGTPIIDMANLIAYLSSNTAPGQTVSLSILRDGAVTDVPVTLGSRP